MLSVTTFAQKNISGIVSNADAKELSGVMIFDADGGWLATSNLEGVFDFVTDKNEINLIFYLANYEVFEKSISISSDTLKINVDLLELTEELSEVILTAQERRVFNLKRLRDVEGTAIYAGKKTEVVLVEQSLANLASNNARQIYNQVAGLNIYQNDDAGLQLNIGGRGLDPNRTSNFNTRQNGYDISADVLGYPESYYTPPSEALEEIQIVRGAASLQYGTQFGGYINFKFKEPKLNDPFEFVTRNTIGSNGLFTNFTAVGGTTNKLSYYSFFNYKRGDGFRPNSEFESKSGHIHLGYQFNERTKLTAEVTVLKYLAQQAGGLTDEMFEEDPYQSNRERNWFEVDWLLYNFLLSHKFLNDASFTFSFFGLDAARNAIGFRTNRVSQIDPGGVRDLIKGTFRNFGFEARYLNEYKFFEKKSTFLIGGKYYNASNTSTQGPGSDGRDANFNFQFDEFPNYPRQADYTYPNLNVALFGENIIYLNDKLSITPGARFEYIKTESDGFYTRINTDGAGNIIFKETIFDDDIKERSFVLLGLGASYKPNKNLEVYGNISQNYRSITFSDISIFNPAYTINPNIDDEKGFTSDIGLRGSYRRLLSYDLSVFGLSYKDRIGFIQKVQEDGRVVSERGNVGNAFIYGIESLIDFNLGEVLLKSKDYNFSYYLNSSFITSEYTESLESGIVGNKVEFVPEVNIKTGFRFGYKNFLSTVQYTYLSEQFTDASNAVSGSLSGVIGKIPSYNVLDFSVSYRYKILKLEAGVNNLLNNAYFTRRATGYPGPGIIPSPPRNWYTTLEIRL